MDSNGDRLPGARKAQQPSNRIATLGSLRNDDERDDEKQEAFYAGGGQTGGGQQILGPKKESGELDVKQMFGAARQSGAEVVDRVKDGKKKAPVHFQGTAYRLGDENEPGSVIPAASTSEVEVVLRIWRNGFTVNDGPLRDPRDPASRRFLLEVMSGGIPQELLQLHNGKEIILEMEDHCQEEYVKPKELFSGQGYTLGSDSGASVVETSNVSATPSLVQVDESLPVTTIQIRLPNGSRMMERFNHSHSVADIRNHLVANRASALGSNFVFMASFPSKEISDESMTLKEANLINSVVVVRNK